MVESPETRIRASRFRKWRNSLQRRRDLRSCAKFADDRVIDWGWDRIPYNRLAVVSKLIGTRKDAAYLEIGCASNALFHAVPAIEKVGVDPLSGGTVRDTSDNFFAANRETFDVIFVDGLHTYAQVRRDIVNALGVLRDGGWIAFHDVLPSSWTEQNVPNISRGAWTGDVWKAAFELAATPELEFKIVAVDHGVGVLRKKATRQADVADLSGVLEKQGFTYFYDNMKNLPIVNFASFCEWVHGT